MDPDFQAQPPGRPVTAQVVGPPARSARSRPLRTFLVLLLVAGMALAVLALGVYPQPLVAMMEPTLDNLVSHITQSKL